MSVLNPGLTILKPGMLAETIEGEKWGSKKYLLKDCSGMNYLRWVDIPYNSPILIVDVDEKHITLLTVIMMNRAIHTGANPLSINE